MSEIYLCSVKRATRVGARLVLSSGVHRHDDEVGLRFQLLDGFPEILMILYSRHVIVARDAAIVEGGIRCSDESDSQVINREDFGLPGLFLIISHSQVCDATLGQNFLCELRACQVLIEGMIV